MPAAVSTAIRLEPVSLRISRRGSGIVAAVMSLLLAVTGVTAMTRESEFRIPATALGIACWGCTLYSVRTAIRNLLGTLTVDDSGIRLAPRVWGIRLSWSDVSMWCQEGERRAAVFRFWKSGFNTPITLPAKWLKQPDRERLAQALLDFAPAKARRF